MTGYTKLFQSLVTSSIWQEPNETRLVWITMLALADREGVVEASVPGLANVAKVSLEKTQEALKVLKGPDKWSRSQEHEGRRVEEVDGGWRILNHGKYREKLSSDDRREYQRVKQAEYRRVRRAKVPGEALGVKAMREGNEGLADRITSESLPKAKRPEPVDVPNELDRPF